MNFPSLLNFIILHDILYRYCAFGEENEIETRREYVTIFYGTLIEA